MELIHLGFRSGQEEKRSRTMIRLEQFSRFAWRCFLYVDFFFVFTPRMRNLITSPESLGTLMPHVRGAEIAISLLEKRHKLDYPTEIRRNFDAIIASSCSSIASPRSLPPPNPPAVPLQVPSFEPKNPLPIST